MEYADQVYSYLLKLRPGEKINVSSSQDPEKFKSTVKDLMDNYGMRRGFSFNDDYSILRRNYEFNYEYKINF